MGARSGVIADVREAVDVERVLGGPDRVEIVEGAGKAGAARVFGIGREHFLERAHAVCSAEIFSRVEGKRGRLQARDGERFDGGPVGDNFRRNDGRDDAREEDLFGADIGDMLIDAGREGLEESLLFAAQRIEDGLRVAGMTFEARVDIAVDQGIVERSTKRGERADGLTADKLHLTKTVAGLEIPLRANAIELVFGVDMPHAAAVLNRVDLAAEAFERTGFVDFERLDPGSLGSVHLRIGSGVRAAIACGIVITAREGGDQGEEEEAADRGISE